jgi:predicted phage terminase large subunit-like protein
MKLDSGLPILLVAVGIGIQRGGVMARKPADAIHHAGQAERLRVDAHLVEGFVQTFLMDHYADPRPIPAFHRALWDLECSDNRWVAIAAPRGHAKSTAGNHAYLLANLLFGNDDFAVILSSTERLATGHLKSIKDVLWNNEEMMRAFGAEIVRDVETELVARVRGREFCVMVFGAEANLRGALWRQKRPSLVLGDDLENDELVMNPDRRDKFWNWLLNAVLPMGSDYARFRILGTILHMASALERLLNDPTWETRRFRAHHDFDDFSQILWPEKFPEERLRRERQFYINGGNASGYSQEYLSHPIPQQDAYFRVSDMVPMDERNRRSPKLYYGAIDFAVSQKERADFTAFVIGGMEDAGLLCITDVSRGRWDPLEIIEKLFELDRRWRPEFWVAEEGIIRKVLGPFLNAEMVKRGRFLNIILKVPVKDKMSRARSLQARMRAGGVRFDGEAEWYVGYEREMLSFPRGINDDQVDASAWLGLALDELTEHPTPEQIEDEEWFEARRASAVATSDGRSLQTGY